VYTQRLRCSYAESVPSSHDVNRLPIDSSRPRERKNNVAEEIIKATIRALASRLRVADAFGKIPSSLRSPRPRRSEVDRLIPARDPREMYYERGGIARYRGNPFSRVLAGRICKTR